MYNWKFDKTDEIVMDLRDEAGTGYRMAYRPSWGILTIIIFEAGQITGGRDVAAISQEEAWEYEGLLTTPRSVGDAIMHDENEGCVGANFVDGYETLDRAGVDMDFELTNPNSNEWVTCTLGLVSYADPDYYSSTTSFVMRSDLLLQAALPMEALL